MNLLRLVPFSLNDTDIAWVEQTFHRLSLDQKLLQLCNVAMHGDSPEEISRVKALVDMGLGGVTRFVGADLKAAHHASKTLIEAANIPLLISGDIEGGAIGMQCATPVPNQLGAAAMGDAELYAQVVDVLASEAKALGFNWTFTPVLDINAAFRSAIVATRSFGSDQHAIAKLAAVNMVRFQAAGMAATAKHWPGEGYDDRDQHLVTTVNPLDMNAWHAQFGKLYKSMIDSGVMTIMSAHIALPSYAQSHNQQGLELYRPASVSRLLNKQLLREELKFNGLIVSDASAMGGLNAWAARAIAIPEVIENGCDVLLFPSPIEQDLIYLKDAIADGRLSQSRVDAAVLRVLGLKAALGLHRKSPQELIPSFDAVRRVVRSSAHMAVSNAAAAKSVTLVKDVQAILPLSVAKHKRIALVTDPDRLGFAAQKPLPMYLADWLLAEGFEVHAYDVTNPPKPEDTDLVLTLLAQESLLMKSHIFMDFQRLFNGDLRGAMRRDWYRIPHVFVSFGHPYYLYDAPRMPCVVNAYSAIEPVQRAVLECLLGRAPFMGVSPVDTRCGLGDALY